MPYGTAPTLPRSNARRSSRFTRRHFFHRRAALRDADRHLAVPRQVERDVRHAVIHDRRQASCRNAERGDPARLQQIIDRAMAKDLVIVTQRSRKQEDLRGVLREISSPGEAVISVMPAPPRHAAGASPLSRAMRGYAPKAARNRRPHARHVTANPTTALRRRYYGGRVGKRRVLPSCLSKT